MPNYQKVVLNHIEACQRN